MKKLITLILLSTLFIACNQQVDESNEIDLNTVQSVRAEQEVPDNSNQAPRE